VIRSAMDNVCVRLALYLEYDWEGSQSAKRKDIGV
jgi:hypothetical protein